MKYVFRILIAILCCISCTAVAQVFEARQVTDRSLSGTVEHMATLFEFDHADLLDYVHESPPGSMVRLVIGSHIFQFNIYPEDIVDPYCVVQTMRDGAYVNLDVSI